MEGKMILKYTLMMNEVAEKFACYPDAKVVHVDLDTREDNAISIWMECPAIDVRDGIVDSSIYLQDRVFRFVWTGQLVPPKWEYVGSVKQHVYMWHVYEVKL